ncbi:hypothetical protein B488_06490 [Liberibacter crescens BT-1]|uniref:Uncharacterized protein n=1 Tax=Liberibacter crescens (strain BT-1) TaxID=1215343 RepID=L0EW92_LIBCB|nr:hypothetical protein [Liberibacter crescens]AGA64641.1 hypothetical protein B488_06490 [Liberibacter crescens BT-1]AMC12754.1 hypothetical protein RL73_03360 [Liberibacter crescens]
MVSYNKHWFKFHELRHGNFSLISAIIFPVFMITGVFFYDIINLMTIKNQLQEVTRTAANDSINQVSGNISLDVISKLIKVKITNYLAINQGFSTENIEQIINATSISVQNLSTLPIVYLIKTHIHYNPLIYSSVFKYFYSDISIDIQDSEKVSISSDKIIKIIYTCCS